MVAPQGPGSWIRLPGPAMCAAAAGDRTPCVPTDFRTRQGAIGHLSDKAARGPVSRNPPQATTYSRAVGVGVRVCGRLIQARGWVAVVDGPSVGGGPQSVTLMPARTRNCSLICSCWNGERPCRLSQELRRSFSRGGSEDQSSKWIPGVPLRTARPLASA